MDICLQGNNLSRTASYSITFSYNDWNDIRINIMLATFDYIQYKFQKDEELYNNIRDEDDENYIGDNSEYHFYKKLLIEFIKAFNLSRSSSNDGVIDKFISLSKNLSYVDALIYFNIGGLYSLCNKSEQGSYYSVGNSIDICHLFDLIKPFVKINDEECHSTIYEFHSMEFNIYLAFKQCVKNNHRIGIRDSHDILHH